MIRRRASVTVPRYRFGDFTLSPRRRVLLREGRELPLIPRYFDLLLFLVERRHEAVHRRDIFDHVWADVIVSDSALSQAIRTIRRTLDDDPREPRFIRTVSRHGYRFVSVDLVEEEDAGDEPSRPDPALDQSDTPTLDAPADAAGEADPFEPLLERLTRADEDDAAAVEDRREAAELLHVLGTAEALRRLGTRPGHAAARAVLRDTRWDVPGAGAVPLVGVSGAAAAVRAIVLLRLRRAARAVAVRWLSAAMGSGLAGLGAGLVGGLVLVAAPGSLASLAVVPVLALVGFGCGAVAGAGVGAGLEVAEATMRSRRTVALLAGGAIGGGTAGLAVQVLARWSLATLVGVDLDVGGGLEGVLIGGAAGLGYAMGTSRDGDGLAAPRGRRRLLVAGLTALACGAAALAIASVGRPLVGGTLHALAEVTQGAQTTLTPLGRLLGEPGFGPITSLLIGTAEGALFGLGLAMGLTRRPRSRKSHATLTTG
jgi:DNA-binding winged helix-turn-helix (wHTH) protein